MSDIIYFDNNATTQVDQRVIETMLPYFSEYYGNASSKLHAYGWLADAAVEKAREQVASMIGAEPAEIIFTSGATESVNTAIAGIYRAYKSKGNHIITAKTEHKAVLDTCKFLEEYQKADVTYLDVDREGIINTDELLNAIKPTTILITIMMANNETGVIQPYEMIGEIARKKKVLFFTDATQFAGKIRLDLREIPVDALALSAHKFYGPKGIGLLYLRRKNPRVNIVPIMHGGAHENGKRAGTLNVPLIAGFSKACEIAQAEMWDNNTMVSKIRAYFEHQLLATNGIRINGSTRHRLYNTSNVTFPHAINTKELMRNYAFSTGSACTSGSGELSHVLRAMGINDNDIKNSFRFSFGKNNTLQEIQQLLKSIGTA